MTTPDPDDQEIDERIETLTFNLKDLFKPSDLRERQLLNELRTDQAPGRAAASEAPAAPDRAAASEAPAAPDRAVPAKDEAVQAGPAQERVVRELREDGTLRTEIVYGENGLPESETHFGADGATVFSELVYQDGQPAYKNRFDDQGRAEVTVFFAEDGKTILSQESYGANGELCSRIDFFEDGKTVRSITENTGRRSVTSRYYPSGVLQGKLIEQGGKTVWETQLDEQGRLLELFDGFARTAYERDGSGNLTGSVSRWQDGSTHWYDAAGSEVRHE